MSKRDLTTAADTPHLAPRRPLFIVFAGRGGTGKTFLLRLICEWALAAGRSFVIADGDRTNRSLPRFFEGVQAPKNADDRVVRSWMETIVETMVTDGLAVVVDLGGGDMVLKRMAIEEDLQTMLQERGAVPVILHLLTADVESLGYLAAMEAPGPSGKPLFAPERTALILNEGRAPGGFDPEEVFAPIREHRVFRAAVRRGAQAIVMPQLKPAYDIDRRHLLFADAAAGKTSDGLPPLGIFDRQRVAMWLRAMDAAFKPIAEWLP